MTAATPPPSFTLVLPDDTQLSGPVVDLRGRPTAPPRSALVRAVRAGGPVPEPAPAVLGSPPGPAHDHVGLLRTDRSFDRRAALAALAAARGVQTPHDPALATARRRLRAMSAAPLDTSELREARRRAAEAGSQTERLRERVATIRGRVTALRAANDDVDKRVLEDAEDSLAAATRRLSEVSTRRVAAGQRLALLEARARNARDDRERRLRLEDRIGNLERAQRDARVAAVAPAFAAARDRIATRVSTGGDTVSRSTALTGALAAARLAPPRAPLVVAPDVVALLGGVAAAADALAAPLLVR